MVGFLRGILLGGVVAVAGLVAVSQLVGLVSAPGPLDVTAVAGDPAASGTAVPDAPVLAADPATVPARLQDSVAPAPETDAGASTAPPQVLSDAPAGAGGVVGSDQPLAPVAGPDETPVATGVAAPTLGLEGDAPATAASAPAEPPPQPPSTAPEGGGRQVADAGASPTIPPGIPAPTAPVPSVPAVPGGESAPKAADLPPPPTLAPVDEALLQPVPEPPPHAVPVPEPEPAVDPKPKPGLVPPDQNETLAPSPGLGDQAPGVVTGRLPRIGDPAPATDADTAPDLAISSDLPPLQRYARPFAAIGGKPLFSILLEDTGSTDVNRPELAALEIPLTIVIDPLSNGAAERAAIWRAGGQEVVMAASGIPAGAKASDLEQTFQALAEALPEAVAVIDTDGRTFQDNRPLATQVVPILAAQGRGLVTFDRGLNAADQVARREKLGAATIFRRLDGEGEDAPVIRRYLDRAAFKAAQDGRVAVIGTLRPETVAAILEWTVEGRSATVALAPISALMAGDGG